MGYDIVAVDWVKHVERKRALFISLAFTDVESKDLLFTAAGIRLQHNLYTYKHGVCAQYRSAKELARLQAHFLALVRKNDPRLAEWKELCVKHNKRADELVVQFQNAQVPGTDFAKYYQEFLNILFYGVTLPFLVLSAIDSAVQQGDDAKKYKTVLALFEPTRGVAKYPALETTMLAHFWKLAAQVCNIKDYLALAVLTPPELQDVFAGKKFDAQEIQRRENGCVLWRDPDTQAIVFNYDSALLARFEQTTTPQGLAIKGTIAFAGTAQGRVCIVNTIADMARFKDGDIVVSINTNPSLMPVLQKCAAIVTDEGGIMCHSAVVSRELKKPCVIGTTIATKTFKDGDIIEVDARKGTVRKVS